MAEGIQIELSLTYIALAVIEPLGGAGSWQTNPLSLGQWLSPHALNEPSGTMPWLAARARGLRSCVQTRSRRLALSITSFCSRVPHCSQLRGGCIKHLPHKKTHQTIYTSQFSLPSTTNLQSPPTTSPNQQPHNTHHNGQSQGSSHRLHPPLGSS